VPLLSRAYEGDGDLRLMQGLAAECWRLQAPFVDAHVGDLAWRMYQHLDKLAEVRIRLWLGDDQRPLGWAWLWLPAELDFQLHPEASPAVLDDMLAWFEAEAQPSGGGHVQAWALEAHGRTVAALEAAGYERSDDSWYEHMVAPLAEQLPEPELPRGFELRTVRGEEDVERRVEVHRAAFAPSRVVAESYRRVMRSWPYRPGLDHVVVAPDGAFAAFCLCWLDEVNRVGDLEPVGTHPNYRRRGLGRAVCLAGLRSLREAGADTALVYSVGRSDASRLYESIGFAAESRHLPFRKRSRRESPGDVRR
jgi:ribosomal protein S18 acetylase RimI-like enzyme